MLIQTPQSDNNQIFIGYKILFIAWLLLLSSIKLAKAQTQPVFVKINDAKVLPSSSISSITQDKDGFIWIGTKNGLSCYDGNTYKIYNQATGGLEADDISVVFVDSRDRIWVGTLNGLQLLNKNEDWFFAFKSRAGDKSSISSNEVNTIFEDSAKRIWIGTEGGLNQFIEKDSSFVHYQANATNNFALSHNSVKSIFEDVDKNLWVGTFGGGLNRFDVGRKHFQQVKLNLSDGNAPAANYINVIKSFSTNELLLGTSGEGLLSFNIRKNQLKPFFQKQEELAHISVIRAILQEPGGTIWIGTDGNGLLKIQDTKTKEIKVKQFVKNNAIPASLSSNAVYTIFSDRQSNIWLGTAWNGINILKRKDAALQFYYTDFTGANLSPVLSIYKNKEKLWFGTDGFGLNILNLFSQRVLKVPRSKVGGDYVQLIKERRAGDLFYWYFF